MLKLVKCEHCVEMISDPLECPYNRLGDELKEWLRLRDTSPAQYCFSVQVSQEAKQEHEYDDSLPEYELVTGDLRTWMLNNGVDNGTD